MIERLFGREMATIIIFRFLSQGHFSSMHKTWFLLIRAKHFIFWLEQWWPIEILNFKNSISMGYGDTDHISCPNHFQFI